MSSGARLTALRLVGFKSFAEKTTIEFGPGVSAVVGPNGSGKSNLADALRWTMGEQGRMLRTRRAEDVIFAGSSSRRAIGMADVTLVIDNSDRLLPVDFGEVEIGRRLYRSGESEYLLNRQRIRLRDLTELLDEGNLADNAFLFIGQGMVDQALALRPEERRPLFEEAAGVRRHERRRRQAEAELTEAEANLERLRDLLGELRPQAKRLAAQSEQLQARRTAGLELAEVLLAAARSRWLDVATAEGREARALDAARNASDKALAELHAAEQLATQTSAEMASHADEERARRAVVERERADVVEHRVKLARIESELSSLDESIQRARSDREAIAVRLREAALGSSVPQPTVDQAIATELEAVDRELVVLSVDGRGPDANAELTARRAEHDRQQRRSSELEQNLLAAQTELLRLGQRLTEAQTEHSATTAQLTEATAVVVAAEHSLESARTSQSAAAAEHTHVRGSRAELESEVVAARSRLSALESALEAMSDEGLARAARARGAKLVAEGVEIDARFRRAVAAVLDSAATAFVVDDPGPLAAPSRRGALVMRGHGADRRSRATAARGAATATAVGAAREVGGGSVTDQVRRDPQGELTRLLERVVWTPDLAGAVRVSSSLPAGWRVVTLNGEVVTDEGVVKLAGETSVLELRAERDEAARSLAGAEVRLGGADGLLEAARRTLEESVATLRKAQAALDEARRGLRVAEDADRVSGRRAEQWLREETWQRAQVERLTNESAAARELAATMAEQIAALSLHAADTSRSDEASRQKQRLEQLRARREELGRLKVTAEAKVAAWQDEQRRADVRRAVDESRVIELESAEQRASTRHAQLTGEAESVRATFAAAQLREKEAAAALEQIVTAGTGDRARLLEAERGTSAARERLRIAEVESRRAEVASVEARLQLEQIREQLLVELAGLGSDGMQALQASMGSEEAFEEGPEQVESALGAVIGVWRSAGPSTEPPPGPSRVATLRRRYHDLGAGNPFAVEEYAELRERLESMESQRTDLESAISSTRELIASLTQLISEQFRKTFTALEDAFARRFQELFGGGDAQLSLTAPDDLSATGVEIHARPPGKKRQPLSMLSGGERALTAVSLLLAMLEVRPVPFCVLDEVDAALDEANVGRFSRALRGLSDQTQFIVITHNRGTIEGADALYGVTIGDDAVSRVVSLRLPKPPETDGNGHKPSQLVDETEVAVA